MSELKLFPFFNEYIDSENTESILEIRNKIKNDELKSELEKFISLSTKRLNIDGLNFSTLILTAYEFNFENSDKHFDFLLESLNKIIEIGKINHYKFDDKSSFFVAQFFDIILYQISPKFDITLVSTYKEIPKIVNELSEIHYKIGSHIEIALLKSIELLDYQLIDFEESKIVLKKIIKNHFDDYIVEQAKEKLIEIERNYS
ncbi:hypothetical protein D3C71_00030 [compost metagenome]